MLVFSKPALGAAALSCALVLGACGSSTIAGVDTTHNFLQIQRLGNPLVSEVFFPKRDHGRRLQRPPDPGDGRRLH